MKGLADASPFNFSAGVVLCTAAVAVCTDNTCHVSTPLLIRGLSHFRYGHCQDNPNKLTEHQAALKQTSPCSTTVADGIDLSRAMTFCSERSIWPLTRPQSTAVADGIDLGRAMTFCSERPIWPLTRPQSTAIADGIDLGRAVSLTNRHFVRLAALDDVTHSNRKNPTVVGSGDISRFNTAG